MKDVLWKKAKQIRTYGSQFTFYKVHNIMYKSIDFLLQVRSRSLNLKISELKVVFTLKTGRIL
jgi:hypothetical protein